MELNDLYSQARAGDQSAEEALFAGLTARFRLFARQRLGSRDEAEEVAQEAIKTVLEKYREIDFESSFSGWAYQVLNNKLMTMVTTRDRRRNLLENEALTRSGSHAGDGVVILEARLLECLRKVNRVNPRHARILNLHHLGFGVEEICTKLKLTRNNFYSVLSRARSLLQRCLGESDRS